MDELVDMEVFPLGNNRDHRSQSRQRHRQPEPDVIDLTLDDESPPHPSLPFPGRPAQINARRMNSQRSPPRLSRTDGSYIGGPPQVIFISDSDDDQGEPVRPHPRRNMDNNRERRERQTRHHHHHHHTHHHHHHRPQQPVDELQEDIPREAPHFTRIASLLHNLPLPMFSFLNNHGMANRHGPEDIAFLGERNLGPQLPPINIGMRLDYGHNAFRGHQDPAPSPKPAHEPPKAAREGFTRDTGEDVVAICPSCDRELAYDPDGDEEECAASSAATPSKRARTKKDKAEHHFFAVKACGHVYCKKCYDNRKPSARNPVDVGFRPDLKTNKGKILCAVDECESDVTNKTAWVGIFL